MVTPLEVHEAMTTANFIIQFIVLGLIGVSLILKRRRNYIWHGNTMLVAVIVNLLLLAMHMAPSFVGVGEDIVAHPLNFTPIVGVVHGISGATAEIFAIWIVVTWAYITSSTAYCSRRKKAMRWTLILWLVAIALGIAYYILHVLYPV